MEHDALAPERWLIVLLCMDVSVFLVCALCFYNSLVQTNKDRDGNPRVRDCDSCWIVTQSMFENTTKLSSVRDDRISTANVISTGICLCYTMASILNTIGFTLHLSWSIFTGEVFILLGDIFRNMALILTLILLIKRLEVFDSTVYEIKEKQKLGYKLVTVMFAIFFFIWHLFFINDSVSNQGQNQRAERLVWILTMVMVSVYSLTVISISVSFAYRLISLVSTQNSFRPPSIHMEHSTPGTNTNGNNNDINKNNNNTSFATMTRGGRGGGSTLGTGAADSTTNNNHTTNMNQNHSNMNIRVLDSPTGDDDMDVSLGGVLDGGSTMDLTEMNTRYSHNENSQRGRRITNANVFDDSQQQMLRLAVKHVTLALAISMALLLSASVFFSFGVRGAPQETLFVAVLFVSNTVAVTISLCVLMAFPNSEWLYQYLCHYCDSSMANQTVNVSMRLESQMRTKRSTDGNVSP